jgi:type IV pilus assembly protein PilE
MSISSGFGLLRVSRKVSRGFTLIEILVAVAIISILAAVAIPGYNEYVMRARIADATAALGNKRAQLETYYDNTTPHTFVGAPSCATDSTTSKFFTFSCSTVAANSYTLQAVGSGVAAGFTFTIDQSNAKATTAAPSGWTTNANCWVMNKAGAC